MSSVWIPCPPEWANMAADDHHMHACTDANCEILAIKCHHCHPMLQCEILAIKSLSGTKLRMSQTDQCGIWWVPWGFTYQILLNPMEYDGFHEVLNIKSIQISSYPKCYGSEVLIIKGWNRKDLTRSIWPSGGVAFINPVLALQQFMPFVLIMFRTGNHGLPHLC